MSRTLEPSTPEVKPCLTTPEIVAKTLPVPEDNPPGACVFDDMTPRLYNLDVEAAMKGFFIPAMVGSEKMYMLLDSGCSHSVIPTKVLDQLPAEAQSHRSYNTSVGTLADGSEVRLEGGVTLKLHIDRRSYYIGTLPDRRDERQPNPRDELLRTSRVPAGL